MLKDSARLLFSRKFGVFFAATLLSNLGTWAQLIAEPWLLLSLGASSFMIGLDSFALSAPAFVLTLVGGVLADRGDRRKVIALFQSIQMLCPAILVVLLLTHTVQPWMVIVLAVVIGITDALSMPAFQSIVPSIVARPQIATGITLNSMQFNLSRVVGPALAGMMMAGIGPVACFVASAVSYLPFIGVAVWILPRQPATAVKLPVFNRRDLVASILKVVRDPKLCPPLLTVLIGSVFCGPLIPFTPVLVHDAFQEGVGSFSTAVTVFGVGGVIGAMVLLAVPHAKDPRFTIGLSLVYGAVALLVGVNPWVTLLPVLLFMAGLFMTATNVSTNARLQIAAPAELRGQAVSIYMLAMRGGLAIGSLATGGLVHWLGVRHALMADGACAIIAQLAAVAWQTRRARVGA
jgi:MFS family permease